MAVDVGSPGDMRCLTGIWNGPERFTPTSGTTRWTCARSGVKLLVDPSKDYRLEIAAGMGPIKIRKAVLLNGKRIGGLEEQEMVNGVYTYDIPSSAFGGRSIADLVFDTDTIVPSEVFPGSPDGRHVGVAVDWVRLTQRGATPAPIANLDLPARIELKTSGIYSRWTHRAGTGYVVLFPYAPDRSENTYAYQQLLRELIYNRTALDPQQRNAVNANGDSDGVQATLFDDSVLYLNPTDKRINKSVTVDGRKYRLDLPAHSMGSISRRDGTADIRLIPPAGSIPK
jgi:hypothetical protein